MNAWVIDASLSLGWFLEDEQDREHSLDVLDGLEDHDFVVPFCGTTKYATAFWANAAASGSHHRRYWNSSTSSAWCEFTSTD